MASVLPATPSTAGAASPVPPKAGAVIVNLLTYPGSPYPPDAKMVALTFDDGPSPIYTPQILRLLVRYHVPASFEIVGSEGAEHPELLHQEAADGMALVDHTWNHVNLTTLNAAGWVTQVDQTDTLLSAFLGHPVVCLRPPDGYIDPAVVPQLANRGLAALMWDIDPSDYLRPPASLIVQRVLSALHPGAIVILHDGGGDRSPTVSALPALITDIRKAGYTLIQACRG
jgi:peptidoglycan/xylan/chitin deacetylase (PgdA/CDA1 family)